MPNNPFKLNKRWVRTFLLITFSSIILYFLLLNFNTIWKFVGRVYTILQPVLIGVVLAYLLSPICDRTEDWFQAKLEGRLGEKRANHWASMISVTLCILIILGVVAALFSLIFPQLFSSIGEVIESGISSESEIQAYITKYFSERPEYMELLTQGLHNLSSWLGKISSQELIPNMVTTVSKHVYTLGVSVFNFFIGIIVSAYCLSRRKAFNLQFKKLLYAIAPDEEKAQYFLQKVHLVNSTFLGFFIGKMIDSLIIGILCFIGTMLIGTPHALLVSVIIGITNIIPFFGPFIGAVPATIIILLADPIQALYFLIFIFLLQQFDGNLSLIHI